MVRTQAFKPRGLFKPVVLEFHQQRTPGNETKGLETTGTKR